MQSLRSICSILLLALLGSNLLALPHKEDKETLLNKFEIGILKNGIKSQLKSGMKHQLKVSELPSQTKYETIEIPHPFFEYFLSSTAKTLIKKLEGENSLVRNHHSSKPYIKVKRTAEGKKASQHIADAIQQAEALMSLRAKL